MRGKEVKGGSATLSYFFVLKCVKRSFPTFQVNLLQLIDVWIFPPVVQFKKTTLAFFLFFKNSRYSYVATSQHINKKIISWRIKNWVIFLSYSLKNEENGERYFKLGYTWRFESCRIDFKGVAAASSSFGGYEVKQVKEFLIEMGCFGSFIAVVTWWCSKVSLQLLCRFLDRLSGAASPDNYVLLLHSSVSFFVIVVFTIRFKDRLHLFSLTV